MHMCEGGQRRSKRKGQWNGFTKFLSDSMHARVPLAGESAEACRKRTMNDCKQRWATSLPAFKKTYADQAHDLNQGEKSRMLIEQTRQDCVSLHEPAVESEPIVPHAKEYQAIAEFVPQQAPGVMGSGDVNFGLAESTVATADENNPGFVRAWSSRWREFCNGVCSQHKAMASLSGTIRLSCLQECPALPECLNLNCPCINHLNLN